MGPFSAGRGSACARSNQATSGSCLWIGCPPPSDRPVARNRSPCDRSNVAPGPRSGNRPCPTPAAVVVPSVAGCRPPRMSGSYGCSDRGPRGGKPAGPRPPRSHPLASLRPRPPTGSPSSSADRPGKLAGSREADERNEIGEPRITVLLPSPVLDRRARSFRRRLPSPTQPSRRYTTYFVASRVQNPMSGRRRPVHTPRSRRPWKYHRLHHNRPPESGGMTPPSDHEHPPATGWAGCGYHFRDRDEPKPRRARSSRPSVASIHNSRPLPGRQESRHQRNSG